jgi:pimeloyl-ACP methyl ester carboxylesterase
MEAAAKLKCPALFILGARDMMTPPRGAEDLIKKIEKSKSTRIEISGHSLMAEAPDATLDALIGFLG